MNAQNPTMALVRRARAALARLVSERVLLAALLVATALIGAAMLFVGAQDSQYMGRDSLDRCAAVMLASGHGFVTPTDPLNADLSNFLKHRQDSLRPDQINQVPGNGVDDFQSCHRYLMYTIGAVWWLLGISWNALYIWQVMVLCLTALIVYALFRLAMGPLLSAIGAFLFAASPAVLAILPGERDFDKAPFILGSILIMGYLAKHPVSKRLYFALAALLGVTAGIGLGFRQDMLLCVAPSVVVIAICARPAGSRSFLQRPVAIALMLVAWYIAAWPILTAMRQQSAQTAHSIIGGMTASCDATLEIPLGSYQLFRENSDTEIIMGYNSFAHRVHGLSPEAAGYTAEAERRAKLFLFDVIKTLPADMMNRGYAAVLWILGDARAGQVYPQNLGSPIYHLGVAEGSIINHFAAFRFVYLAITLLLIAAWCPRAACIVLFLILYFCGTTSMQFQDRHCFHLTFIPLWLMGFTLNRAGYGLTHAKQFYANWRSRDLALRTPLLRMTVFALAVSALIFIPVFAARAYQARTMGDLVSRCRNATLEPVPVESHPAQQDGYVLFSPTQWPEATLDAITQGKPVQDKHCIRTEYLVAEFEASSPLVTWGVDYAADTPPKHPQYSQWLSRPIQLALRDVEAPARVKCFFPIYEIPPVPGDDGGWMRFSGLMLRKDEAASFRGLYRVKNLDDFRLLPDLVIPEDNGHVQLFQTLRP